VAVDVRPEVAVVTEGFGHPRWLRGNNPPRLCIDGCVPDLFVADLDSGLLESVGEGTLDFFDGGGVEVDSVCSAQEGGDSLAKQVRDRCWKSGEDQSNR
jgi:hypothetical protein